MKKFFNQVGKFFCGAFLICALGINSVSAAENPDAMEAFREAMIKSSDSNRVVHEDVFFVVPTMQSELDFIGQRDGENFKATGDFNIWVLNNDSGNFSELKIPFYLTQAAKDMQIYFSFDGKWKKFQSPSLAAVATDIIATPNSEEIEKFISEIKEVALLRETETERTMLVKLDGKKIADEMQAESEKNPADNGTADDKIFHESLTKYLENGFRNSEIWYTWSVNKQNWNTIALTLNLSGLVQQIAQAALSDDSQNWSEAEQNILETVAYFSETKAFTTFLNQEAAKRLEIPKKVLKAELVEDMIADRK